MVRDNIFARIPFMSIAGLAQVPPIVLGIARRAIERVQLLAQTSRAPLANRGWPSKSKPKPVLHGRKRYYALRGATGCEVEALWDAAVPNSPISLELSIPTHCEFARDVAPRHCGRSAVPPGRLDRNLPVLCAGTVLPRRAHRGAAFAGAGRPLGNNWSSAHGADPGSPVF
jgi:hypothetical protein